MPSPETHVGHLDAPGVANLEFQDVIHDLCKTVFVSVSVCVYTQLYTHGVDHFFLEGKISLCFSSDFSKGSLSLKNPLNRCYYSFFLCKYSRHLPLWGAGVSCSDLSQPAPAHALCGTALAKFNSFIFLKQLTSHPFLPLR